MSRDFYLIAYDIADNKRRSRIAKVMESMGARVQGSVFEVFLTQKELEETIRRCKKALNEKEDSLRIYYLCGACQRKIQIIGVGKKSEAPDLVIV